MANRGPSPSMMQMQQHGAPHGPLQQPPPPSQQQQQQHHQQQQQQSQPPPHIAGHPNRALSALNESAWIQIGGLMEQMGDTAEAQNAYERALRANPQSIPAMTAISLLLRGKEDFAHAIDYIQTILQLDSKNGEAWASLGHCYLMVDDLDKAYRAYQSAIGFLGNPKEPKLWYGIGILYDRHGSLEHAEEAFSHVMNMDPNFEKANEIYFRLGIIYKQGHKYAQSLDCFKYIINNPPPPLTEEDIWFQIGHVHEQNKDYENAKNAYHRVLERDQNHAKVLQQLGWLHHMEDDSYAAQERAIEFLEKSVSADQQDAQSWYLLGRCYMQQRKFPKAYEAYQQAVYRDGRNPTFWCSIGVLYYQINQFRDALDAYSRAIRLNPYISEVWYDLGTLYESCNNQISDAMDAYQRAAELDPSNTHIKSRLALLRNGGSSGAQGAAPQPADVLPQTYPPTGPIAPQWQGSGPAQPPAQPPSQPNGWANRLSDVNPPPHPPNSFDSREYRGPPPGQVPPMGRPPSPPRPDGGALPIHHQDNLRPAPGPGPGGPGSGPPPPMRREPTPPPPSHYQQGPPPPHGPPSHSGARPGPPGPGGPPLPALGPGPGPAGGPPPPPSQMQGPSYPGPAPPPPMGRPNGPPQASSISQQHFRNINSPRNDARPLHDNRMPSPKSAYPQHPPPMPFGHRPDQGPPPPPPQSGMGSGPLPPPPSAQAPVPTDGGSGGGSMVASRSDDRPTSVGPKRMREWEEESTAKKQANDENRARLEDIHHRRRSTPPRNEPYRRNSSEARRFEEQRRMEEQRRAEEMRRAEEQRHTAAAEGSYHPSEAAHHTPSHSMGPGPGPGPGPSHLPPMQPGSAGPMQGILHSGAPPPASAGAGPSGGPGPSPVPPQKEFIKEERGAHDHAPPVRPAPPPMTEPERASRSLVLSEDYDDSDEDDKKGILTGAAGAASGGDKKASSPAGAKGAE